MFDFLTEDTQFLTFNKSVKRIMRFYDLLHILLVFLLIPKYYKFVHSGLVYEMKIFQTSILVFNFLSSILPLLDAKL